ncbi:MAG: hypothetical protein JNG84_06335 [Archangium sp.]|nr:hypothetical protein [Archangium sp.]
MSRDDEIDRRVVLRRLPSYGPAWDAAIEFGIDVAQLEENLKLTPEERILQLMALLRFHAMIRPSGPALDDHSDLSAR